MRYHPHTFSIKTHVIRSIFIGLAVFAAFSPVLSGGFINWDDNRHLTENAAVQSLDGEHLRAMFTQRINDIYLPLTTLSFALEYRFAGLTPWVYHLDNVFLHIFNVWLIYALALRMGIGAGGAFFASLVFGLHPAHVESVAWVTERKDVLYAFFYLLALHAYLNYRRKPARKGFWLNGVVVCAVLSMLAKPMALSLPLILLLWDWFEGRPLSRRLFLEKVPVFLAAIGIGWITYAVNARVPGEEGIVQGVLIWLWCLAFYVQQFFTPLVSMPIWSLPEPVALTHWPYAKAVLVIVFTAVALIRFRRNKWLLFSAAYLFLSLFFLLRFDAVEDIHVVAERFLYLPMLGLCLAGGHMAEVIFTSRGKVGRYGMAVAVVAILAFCAVRTTTYSAVWRDSGSLWRHQLAYTPDKWIALNNLAVWLRDIPENQYAERAYAVYLDLLEEGLDIDAMELDRQDIARALHIQTLLERATASAQGLEDTDAPYNLAKFYAETGQTIKAEAIFLALLEKNPDDAEVYYNLAEMYRRERRHDKAVAMYGKLARMDLPLEGFRQIVDALRVESDKTSHDAEYAVLIPEVVERYEQKVRKRDSADGYFHFASALGDLGRYKEAVGYYTKALSLKPDYPQAENNLANAYAALGEGRLAVSRLSKLLDRHPDFAPAYLNLGVIYNKMGLKQEAEQWYGRALDFPSTAADAHFYLGYLDETAARYGEALQHYDLALALRPRNAETHYNRGNVYAVLGKHAEALRSYRETLLLDPGHKDAWINASVVANTLGHYNEALDFLNEARLLGYEPPQKYLDALELKVKRD